MRQNRCECNSIPNHTGVYYFAKGKLMLHLRYDFECCDNYNTTGKTLRYYRLYKGYSTRELADMVGVAQSAYSAWERSARTPRRQEYEKILPLIAKANIQIADNQMEWIARMNNIRSRATEIVNKSLISE